MFNYMISNLLLKEPTSSEMYQNEFIIEGVRKEIMKELLMNNVIAEIIEFMGLGGEETYYRNILVRSCQNTDLITHIFKRHNIVNKLGLHVMDNYDYEMGDLIIWRCCGHSILLKGEEK